MFWAPSPLSLIVPFASEKGDDAQSLPRRALDPRPSTACRERSVARRQTHIHVRPPERIHVCRLPREKRGKRIHVCRRVVWKNDVVFIPTEGFFGKFFAFGDQFRRLAAWLFDSELRAPIRAGRQRDLRGLGHRSAAALPPGWAASERPSQTSSFGSMRTSTGCRGNGGGKTVLPFILSPVPHSRYAAVITKPTRNIPSTPEIFWPPKTADPPSL